MPKKDTFKLQVHIPLDLYQQMCDIAGSEERRTYGAFSKIVILALRHYLQAKRATAEPIELEEI